MVDDGTLPDRRGSLTVDDEGTPTSRTVLIEDGILVGFMQDRLNARLMGMAATGNGRRQSYAHSPMPRMTNTVMLGGTHVADEMIRSVKRGLYAVNFGGGQVDITSGKFVFSATEAYLIEDGKVTAPVKGATLIGNGPDALTKVTMVGNDMALDPGDRDLRQERPGRAGRRRAAHAEAGGADSRRHRGVAGRLKLAAVTAAVIGARHDGAGHDGAGHDGARRRRGGCRNDLGCGVRSGPPPW